MANVVEKLRKSVWESLLGADLNMRYYRNLVDRFRSADIGTKVFLACMSSGTVAGLAIWTDSDKYPVCVSVWKALSGLSAILAVALPILNYTKKVESAARLCVEYADVLRESELLWLHVRVTSRRPFFSKGSV